MQSKGGHVHAIAGSANTEIQFFTSAHHLPRLSPPFFLFFPFRRLFAAFISLSCASNLRKVANVVRVSYIRLSLGSHMPLCQLSPDWCLAPADGPLRAESIPGNYLQRLAILAGYVMTHSRHARSDPIDRGASDSTCPSREGA